MRWSTLLGLAVVALLIAAPLGLPVFAMTLLTELVILGLFAMSLDLMVGYTRLVSFGHVAAYGLGAYASGYMLLNSSMPLPLVVLLATLADGGRRHRRGLGVHARNRRLVLDADARVRPAPLRHCLQMDVGDGRLGRSCRHSRAAPVRWG